MPGIPGTASNNPELLCPCIRTKFYALRNEALEQGIITRVIETRRDEVRQAHYIAIGTSWTTNSYHLPQPPLGLALAFDLAPVAYLAMKGWNPAGEDWETLGKLGKSFGLEWGGDWKTTKDRPHFQLKKCQCTEELKA